MQLPKGKTESAILSQIQAEYNYGFSVVQLKLIQFTDQDKLFNGIENKDKIDLKTAYYIINTMMAVYYSDQLEVRFSPFSLDGERQAKNLNYLAKFLQKEMGLATVNYEVQLNRLMRGVGIKILIGYDKRRNCPIWKAVDTRQWIPDPNVWWDRNEAQFHGFKRTVSKASLTPERGYFNLDKVLKGKDSWTIYQQVQANKAAGLNPMAEQSPIDSYDIYDHMTVIDGERWIFCTNVERTALIRAEKIKPVYDAEKEDPLLVGFPVVLDYFEPKKYDPYGTNVLDLVQAPHRYKNIFANLMFIREKDLALGDPILFDATAINKNTLTQPTINKLLIPVDASKIQGGNIQNAMAVAPRNPSSGSTYEFQNYMDRAIQSIVAIDSRQMGIPGDRAVTLGEAQQLQANNNLKTRFRNVINFRAEEDFWKDTIRAMKENFPDNKKMLVRVTKSYGNRLVQFEAKDFMTNENPDVEIVSRSELEAENAKKLQTLTPLLLATMNSPTTSQYARSKANRKMYELSGIDEEEALEYVNLSYEEMDALMLLPLLDKNDMAGAEIKDLNADHNTYIQIFQRALDTPAKKAAIYARQLALVQSGQAKQAQQAAMMGGGQQGQGFNAMATSQMMNTAQQQATPNVITRGQQVT